MKKVLCLLLVWAMPVLLCGCNSDVPDLTPEQTALISEYATHLLVKHSELSDRNLLDEKEHFPMISNIFTMLTSYIRNY